MEEVDDLFEGRVWGQVVDVVPDVEEASHLAVDVGYRRLCGDDVLESFASHEAPSVDLWGGS